MDAEDWSPELTELRRHEQMAHRLGSDERVARQRAAGRLTVRERIEILLAGWDVVVDNLGKVPVAAACLGPAAGLGAARVVSAHFSVMVPDTSQLFVRRGRSRERVKGRRGPRVRLRRG